MINEPASNLATKFIDAEGVTIGSSLLLRERTEISGVGANQIATVLAVDPASNDYGLTVRDPNSTVIVSRLGQTLTVQFDPGHTLGAITTISSITNTVGVHVTGTTGTLNVKLDPSSVVQISNTPNVNVSGQSATLNVQLDPGHTLGSISGIGTTVTVKTDPSSVIQISNTPTIAGITNTVGVHITGTAGTIRTKLDPESTISGIQSTIRSDIGKISDIVTVKQATGSTFAVYFDPAAPAVNATFSAASLEVVPTTGSRKTTDDTHAAQRVLIVGSQTAASLTINGTVIANAGTGSFNVQFDPGHTLGKVDAGLGTFNVQLDPGHTLGSISSIGTTVTVKTDPSSVIQISNAPTITGITNSINVYLGSTGGTIWIKPDPAGTYFVNAAHTASIFTVSGTTSTIGNNTLVAPSASYNFKVFAYSIQTTGLVSAAPRFTTGASAGATELWRPLITASSTSSMPVGANLAVPPPGFLFATGTNVTLALYLDTATLFHYSVSYIKESA